MERNIIFVFSGTGNSLWVAKEIAKELQNCEIVSMGCNSEYLLSGEYCRVGFVYPVYGGGLPLKVREFVSRLDFSKSKNLYTFAVSTCGKLSRGGNSTRHLSRILKTKGTALNYGAKLDVFANYVVLYEMESAAKEIVYQSAKNLQPIIKMIKDKIDKKANIAINPVQHLSNIALSHFLPDFLPNMDKKFNVSDDCVKCGICMKVCPVNNIDFEEGGKPLFRHHCEQCVACIQNCPTKAINYKNKTQKRRRYVHPDISWKDLAALNGYTE
ncbi:EFR1 family ferrodoxin [Anaerocolumna xylanovorans]|uniref:Ferredoxin n=1 Tax=Anaerocolumna xylanovorans DSM 12503 TaxID=1121345 RepID=A0A1M7YIW1_9FIRM|nr:EFR1 family ferrodoxin [Anaerocolumna xylanovorans]SHO52458.1 4Fe-4S binding domain-containing protein [Anaerocolumna xylanovorans DSM 12503]